MMLMSHHGYLNQWFSALAVEQNQRLNSTITIKQSNKTGCPRPISTESESTEVMSKHV